MPRDREDVRRKLQLAALELFRDHGYEHTTAAEIATRAGVTERTFFRHFPDKREALFDGDLRFVEALTNAIRAATPSAGPWRTMFEAFRSIEPLFLENRAFAEPRRHVIAANPALEERAMAKSRLAVAALTAALAERGVAADSARLAAQIGMTTMNHAVSAWFDDGSSDLDDQIVRAFQDVAELFGPLATTPSSARAGRARP